MVVKDENVVRLYEQLKSGVIKDIVMEIKPLTMKIGSYTGVIKQITFSNAYQFKFKTDNEEIDLNLLKTKGGDKVVEYVYETLNAENPSVLDLDDILSNLVLATSYRVNKKTDGSFIQGGFINFH